MTTILDHNNNKEKLATTKLHSFKSKSCGDGDCLAVPLLSYVKKNLGTSIIKLQFLFLRRFFGFSKPVICTEIDDPYIPFPNGSLRQI